MPCPGPNGSPHWTRWQVDTTRYQWQRETKRKLHFVHHLVCLNLTGCRLGCATHLGHSSVSWSGFLAIRVFNLFCCTLMTLLSSPPLSVNTWSGWRWSWSDSDNTSLKLKMSKCHFFQREVKYLGHVISAEGVATDPEKARAVREWKRPSTVTELRSFLGFSSYYRRFVEGFAKHAAPLHKLVAERQGTRKKPSRTTSINLEAHWNEQCEKAFQTLKKNLNSTPVLGYGDFTRPFILEVDASYQGLGAVLSQEQEGARRPIALASRGLRKTERNMQNYSSMKLEFLALKWAVTEKFREYLLGSKFTIYTDNNPLSYLQTAKLAAVEQRWASELFQNQLLKIPLLLFQVLLSP